MEFKDLLDKIADETGETKAKVRSILDAAATQITQAVVAGDQVNVRNLGAFTLREREARVRTDPKTGAQVDVPSAVIPAFRPAKAFRDQLS